MIISPVRIVLFAGIAGLSLAACGTGYRNVCEYLVADGPCRALTVVAQEGGDALGWVDPAGNLRLVRAETDVLAHIQSVAIAPDGSRAAIVSVGEGHPVLSVYRLADLLAEADRPGKRLPAETSVDPYPLAIEEVGWLDSETIEFRSAIDFTRVDRELRRVGYDQATTDLPVRTWRWHIHDDVFSSAP